MSTKSSHTAYTTFLSVIPGFYEQESTGTGWTQHDQTITVTVTNPASYNAMVGYPLISITSSTETTTATMSATPSKTDVPSTTSKLSMGSLVGIAFGCIIMGILWALLAAWLWRKRRARQARRSSVGAQTVTTSTDGSKDDGMVIQKAELAGDGVAEKEQLINVAELSNAGSRHELDSRGVSEGGSHEAPAELAG